MFAAVDVGANSVHLLVAAVEDHRLIALADESVKLGLGALVEASGCIAGPGRTELVAVLASYAETARQHGARGIAIVGTEPMRRAVDARAVVIAVEAAARVPCHVLEHDEEALLNLLGATGGRRVDAPIAVVDIGGGSSEVVVVEPGRRARSVGLAIGGSSLARRVVAHDPPTVDEIVALRARAPALVEPAPPGAPVDLLAVGGTASNLAKVVPATAADRTITREGIEEAYATLASAPAAEIAARFAITAVRVGSLPSGAALLEALMARYHVPRARLVEEGLREGVVLALARAGAAWRDRLESLAYGWAS